MNSRFFMYSRNNRQQGIKRRNIYQTSTWSIVHSNQNDFVICHLFRTMAIFVRMTISISSHYVYVDSYGCQLTWCSYIKNHDCYVTLSPPPLPFCPSLSLVPTRCGCYTVPFLLPFLHVVVTTVVVPGFLSLFFAKVVSVCFLLLLYPILCSLLYLFCGNHCKVCTY